jgi:hypothetical protein
MGEEARLMTRWGQPPLKQVSPVRSVWAGFAAEVVMAGGEWVSARRSDQGDTLRSLRKVAPMVERLIIEEMIRTGERGEVEVMVARDANSLAWLYARLIPSEISDVVTS